MKYNDVNNYFNKINNHEKAQILGFIFADGYIKEDQNKLQIDISIKDIKYLKKIKARICPERKFYLMPDKGSCGMVRLNITNKNIIEDLKKYGLHQAKSFTLKWPTKLPKKFENSFILGYFDGDGCITKNKKPDYRIEILGTKNLLYNIAKRINKFLMRPLKICKKGKIYKIQFGGNKQIIKFCDWIYKDSSLFLKRKREIYEHIGGNI